MAHDEARALARSTCGALVAAAGCGKTEILATAVANYSSGRELILTHTHGGIDAIRRRLRRFSVPSTKYALDTLAGWALRLAASFPATSQVPCVKPRKHEDYVGLYPAAQRLVEMPPIREVLRASYSGVYVDEYQDCTIEQHALILALRNVLPCRVVGDPLQGIFDFRDSEQIRWSEHVEPQFESIPAEQTPWRWRQDNRPLGEWLQHAREKIRTGAALDLDGAPVQWIANGSEHERSGRQARACIHAAKNPAASVVAIHRFPPQCHGLAKRLRGMFSCVEAIDTDALYDHARRIQESEGLDRSIAVLEFAGTCMTKVRTEMAAVKVALEKGKRPKGDKFATQKAALLAIADQASMAPIEAAITALRQLPEAKLFRRELLREMVRAVRAVATQEVESLSEAAWLVRNRTRRHGRPLPRCAVGTTLLVKGLEFKHAVVLDADSYDGRNLYVALTRGSESLTIVSDAPRLVPPTVAVTARGG